MGFNIAANNKWAKTTCIRMDGPLNHIAWEKKISLWVWVGPGVIRWALLIEVLEDRETHQRDFPGGFENTNCGCGEATCQASAGGLWKLSVIPAHKPARKQGLYNHKEQNSANNWWAWERTRASDELTAPGDSWFQSCKALNRASSYTVPKFLTHRNWDDNFVL